MWYLMCNKSVFTDFSTNISNRFSIVRYDFWCCCWCFDFDVYEIDEQLLNAVFVHVDIDFDVNIEKREDFDALTERETISIQNIDLLDVAIDVDIDVTNEIKKNELSMIDSEWLTDDVNINADSLDDENVAKNVRFAIVILTNSLDVNFANFAFDIKKNVDMTANIAIDVISVNSLDVDFASSVFDVAKDVNIAISLVVIKLDDAITANSIATNFSIFFW